jgi:hypothetical protein
VGYSARAAQCVSIRARSDRGRCDSKAGATDAAQEPTHDPEARRHRGRRATKRSDWRGGRAGPSWHGHSGGPASGVAGGRGDDPARAQRTAAKGSAAQCASSGPVRQAGERQDGGQVTLTAVSESAILATGGAAFWITGARCEAARCAARRPSLAVRGRAEAYRPRAPRSAAPKARPPPAAALLASTSWHGVFRVRRQPQPAMAHPANGRSSKVRTMSQRLAPTPRHWSTSDRQSWSC